MHKTDIYYCIKITEKTCYKCKSFVDFFYTDKYNIKE